MILYLFTSLLHKRRDLIREYKKCKGEDVEVKLMIDWIEGEILMNNEFYFGKLLKTNVKTYID